MIQRALLTFVEEAPSATPERRCWKSITVAEASELSPALMVDMLAGLFSNAAYLTHVKSWVDSPDEPQNLGHFFILIDTSRLGPTSWLAERMRDFAQILHDSPPARAESPVIVPGEIELGKMAAQRRDGLRMPRDVIELMQVHAARLAPQK